MKTNFHSINSTYNFCALKRKIRTWTAIRTSDLQITSLSLLPIELYKFPFQLMFKRSSWNDKWQTLSLFTCNHLKSKALIFLVKSKKLQCNRGCSSLSLYWNSNYPHIWDYEFLVFFYHTVICLKRNLLYILVGYWAFWAIKEQYFILFY